MSSVVRIAGRDGELVDVFVASLAEGGRASAAWLQNATEALALALCFGDSFDGNSHPASVLPLLRARIEEVLGAGVAEDLLVKALRDTVTEFFAGFADATEADKSRNEMRRRIEHALTDPAQFHNLKQYMPGASEASDEQFRQRLIGLADRVDPTNVDEVSERRRNVEIWTGLTKKYLSDEVFAAWSHNRTAGTSPDRREG